MLVFILRTAISDAGKKPEGEMFGSLRHWIVYRRALRKRWQDDANGFSMRRRRTQTLM
jgi:hypothetical protein